MSLHISAKPGEIAKVVLLPGDPLRAKHIAEKHLIHAVQVSTTRNIFFYTGTYEGLPVTVGASGMGCPSIGIYSYELYREYGAECIMRIGTAGAYSEDLQLFDLVNAERSFSESTYARCAFDFTEDHFDHQGIAFDIINSVAAASSQKIRSANIHSSDVFYRKSPGVPEMAVKNNCVAVEMEAFALFANARHLGKTAAALLTISDIIPTGAHISPEEREQSLTSMTRLALDSAVAIAKKLP
jgi:purine-nucleoside phosphorylase